MEHVVWLFDEAWERRRHRRRQTACAALLVLALAVLAYLETNPGAGLQGAPSRRPAVVAEPPAAVFSQAPYMGVLCPMANSIACDRVGLAIWLKRPAYSVTASIDGRSLRMDRFGDELISGHRPRTEFDGYLRPAGLRSRLHVVPVAGTDTWLGDPTPLVPVRVLINYGRGRYVTTHLRVGLSAGWG